jgi:integrase
MYRALFDTSVWLAIAEHPRRFPELAIVEELVRRKALQLIVPTVAIIEFQRNRANIAHRTETDLIPHIREVRKAAHRIGAPEKKLAEFLEHLDYLSKQGPIEDGGPGQILDRIERLLVTAPTIERSIEVIEAAVQRGLDKRAPFHDRNGMADAILLETYAQCVRENKDATIKFAFVTGDKDDFSAPHGNHKQPHPDIADLFTPERSCFFHTLLDALNQIDSSLVSEILTREEPTVASVIKQYLDVTSIGSGYWALKSAADTKIGEKKVSKLKPSDYVEFAEHRRKSVKGNTVNQELGNLGAALKWAQQNISANVSIDAYETGKQEAAKRGLISKKSEKRAVRRLSIEDEQRLIARFAEVKVPKRNDIDVMPIMTFAIWSTRRREEILKLRWDDFDEKTGWCKVRNAYNSGKDLPFRIVGKALEVVLKQKEKTGTGEFIFSFNPGSMGSKFSRIKNELNINIIFDDLREEGIRRLLESNKYSTEEILDIVGDSDRVLDIKAEMARSAKPT